LDDRTTSDASGVRRQQPAVLRCRRGLRWILLLDIGILLSLLIAAFGAITLEHSSGAALAAAAVRPPRLVSPGPRPPRSSAPGSQVRATHQCLPQHVAGQVRFGGLGQPAPHLSGRDIR
jgi:hypothetical protein